jgi:hypothetical protein
LTLAADCLDEALQLDAAVRQQVETVLIANLESDDPELFKLAAEVKLQRRLRNLQRIDENREIDRTFISCAEYQLFLDEMREKKEFYQPDHWTIFHFPKGSALQPIAGVRAQDAKEFCEWLSQKENKKYRCPTLAEAQEFFAVENHEVATWCDDGSQYRILQWNSLKTKQNIESKLTFNKIPLMIYLDQSRSILHSFDLSLALDFSSSLARDIALARNLAGNLDFVLARTDYPTRSLNDDVLQDFLEEQDFLAAQRHLQELQSTNDFEQSEKNLLTELLVILTTDDSMEQRQAWQRYLAYLAEYAVFRSEMIEKEQDKRTWWQRLLSWQKVEGYVKQREKYTELYAWTKIVEARQKGELPAWEGIRIVRERDV